jgi:hypothetical protein
VGHGTGCVAHFNYFLDACEVNEQRGDDKEEVAIADLELRLRRRFPDLDPAVVEAAVRVSHGELTGPIRDFVPLLVERKARDRLSSLQPRVDDPPAEGG